MGYGTAIAAGAITVTYTIYPPDNNTGTNTMDSPSIGFGGGGSPPPSDPSIPIFIPQLPTAGTLTSTGTVVWPGLVIDSDNAVTITGGGTITFASSSGVVIDVTAGSHTITNPVYFESSGGNTSGTITLASSTSLAFTHRPSARLV